MQRRDLFDGSFLFILRLIEIAPELQIHPVSGAGAEVFRQSQRSRWGYAPPSMNDLVDALERNMYSVGKCLLGNVQRLEELLEEHLSGMGRFSIGGYSYHVALLVSVVVGNDYARRSAVGPSKADPVLFIDPYAVLSSPVPGEFLQPVARRYAKIVDALRRVELIQLPDCHIPKRAWTGVSCGPCVAPVENVLGRRVGEGRYHIK
jgi:hypothetical protein